MHSRHPRELDYAPPPSPWWTGDGLRRRLLACLFGLLDLRHLLRSRRFRAGLTLVALTVTALVTAGYRSNETAGRACERETAA
jgi:hypothetical protein